MSKQTGWSVPPLIVWMFSVRRGWLNLISPHQRTVPEALPLKSRWVWCTFVCLAGISPEHLFCIILGIDEYYQKHCFAKKNPKKQCVQSLRTPKLFLFHNLPGTFVQMQLIEIHRLWNSLAELFMFGLWSKLQLNYLFLNQCNVYWHRRKNEKE